MVAMATKILPLAYNGEMKISIYCYLIEDILTKLLQICSL